ncbi:hypothetical protein MTO96_020798 [Rhipicephalus appendiculatus]
MAALPSCLGRSEEDSNNTANVMELPRKMAIRVEDAGKEKGNPTGDDTAGGTPPKTGGTPKNDRRIDDRLAGSRPYCPAAAVCYRTNARRSRIDGREESEEEKHRVRR